MDVRLNLFCPSRSGIVSLEILLYLEKILGGTRKVTECPKSVPFH